MRTGAVMRFLGVTHSTLRDWERKRILAPQRNDLNWRVYDPVKVRAFKKQLVFGRKDGKKFAVK